MVKVDSSLLIQIVNFLFLIWVLNMVLYKPIRNILKQRKEKVSGLENRIATLSGDMSEKEDALAAGIRSARADGLKEREGLLQEAAGEEKRIIGEIQQKAQADLTAVREKIAKEADGVRMTLEGQLEDFARAIGQKILGRAV